jgi:hypothetical protein
VDFNFNIYDFHILNSQLTAILGTSTLLLAPDYTLVTSSANLAKSNRNLFQLKYIPVIQGCFADISEHNLKGVKRNSFLKGTQQLPQATIYWYHQDDGESTFEKPWNG